MLLLDGFFPPRCGVNDLVVSSEDSDALDERAVSEWGGVDHLGEKQKKQHKEKNQIDQTTEPPPPSRTQNVFITLFD